jgi:hypothetical protein
LIGAASCAVDEASSTDLMLAGSLGEQSINPGKTLSRSPQSPANLTTGEELLGDDSLSVKESAHPRTQPPLHCPPSEGWDLVE